MATTYDAFISYSHKADGKLAPALESALEGFAKPWYRRRALSLFRDQTSLSASPGLWPSIEQALQGSGYFLLLASPTAAASRWVQQEVAWWLEHKSPETLLIGLTDGHIERPEGAKDFDWEQTDALPPNLKGVFTENPLWVDFRWAQGQEHLSTKHPEFQSALAALAAPLRNIPKEDLIGEDVRQHRRALLLAQGAALVLVILLIAAVAAALFARIQQVEAETQRDEARRQAQIALSRQLAAQALSHTDDQLDLGLLLSLEGNKRTDTIESRGSLLSALEIGDIDTFVHSTQGSASSIASNQDGSVLVSGGCSVDIESGCSQGLIEVWDVAARKLVGPPLSGHDNFVGSVAVNPDGRVVASGSSDSSVILWDAVSGERLAGPFTEHGGPISSLVFSEDGTKLVSGDTSGTVVVRDGHSGQPIAEPINLELIGQLAIHVNSEGKTLVAGGRYGQVRTIDIWDLEKQQRQGQPLETSWGGWGLSSDIVFSPNGTTLAVTGDGKIILWDVAASRQIGATLVSERADSLELSFSPDSMTLASAGGGTVRLWDLNRPSISGRDLTGYSEGIYGIAFSGDNVVASANSDGTIVFWNTLPISPLRQTLAGYSIAIAGLAPAKDGRVFAMGLGVRGEVPAVAIWDVATGDLLGPVIDLESILRPETLGLGDRDPGFSLAFHPDAGVLALGTCARENEQQGCVEGVVRLWNISTGESLGPGLRGNGKTVYALAFSSDGNMLASGSCGTPTPETYCGPSDIRLWDLTNFRQTGSFVWPDSLGPGNLAFAPTGDNLAACGDGGTVIWNIDTGEQATLSRTDVPICLLSFSADGTVLASTGRQGFVELWHVPTGQQIGSAIDTAPHSSSSLALSPDGKIVTLGAQDGSITLWDVSSGQQIGPALDLGSAPVSSVAFDLDGMTLVLGREDGTIDRRDLSLEVWKQRACQMAGRNLNEQEWRRYLGSEPWQPTCVDAVLQDADAHALQGMHDQAATGFVQAVQLAVTTEDPIINNDICWFGSLDGFAESVRPACDRAVELDPDTDYYYDSRGLARALTGDYPGAIADFERFLMSAKEIGLAEAPIHMREAWITELEAGRNPFDAQTLKALRTEVVEVLSTGEEPAAEGPSATPAATPRASTPSAGGARNVDTGPTSAPLPSPSTEIAAAG